MNNCLKISLAIFGFIVLIPCFVTLWDVIIYANTSVTKTTCTIRTVSGPGVTSYGLLYQNSYGQSYNTIFCDDWGNKGRCGNYHNDETGPCYIVPTDDFTFSYFYESDAKCKKSDICGNMWIWSLIGGVTTMIFTCIISLVTLFSFCCCKTQKRTFETITSVPQREDI